MLDDFLIDYVITSIKNLKVNKTLLYGASNLTEFKQKLEFYAIISQRMTVKSKNAAKSPVPTIQSKLRYYNCGNWVHHSTNCLDVARLCRHKATGCLSPQLRMKWQGEETYRPRLYQVNTPMSDNGRIFKTVDRWIGDSRTDWCGMWRKHLTLIVSLPNIWLTIVRIKLGDPS